MPSFIIRLNSFKECKLCLDDDDDGGLVSRVLLFPSRSLQLTLVFLSFISSLRIDNPLVGTTYAGAVNVLATGVALIIMDKVGRKTLILWSSGGMFLSCIFVVLSLLGYFNNVVALCSVLVYVAFFEIGYVTTCMPTTIFWCYFSWTLHFNLTSLCAFPIDSLGPIPWLIVPEMFAGKHVAIAQGISVQFNWACNFFIG
jgi:Sugar (and other) transporter